MNTLLTPLGRRVLVKREAADTKVGLIHIPDNSQDKSQEATVVALGTGFDDDGREVSSLFAVKPGDRVLIAKYGGTDVKHDGEPHVILNDLDILGILTTPEAPPPLSNRIAGDGVEGADGPDGGSQEELAGGAPLEGNGGDLGDAASQAASSES